MTTPELLTSLQAGLEYAQECLAVHDRDLGRTTPRNKRHAEEMALDIAGLSGCIHHIKMHFGPNVSLPQPKESKNLWDHRYATEQLNAMSRQLMQSEARAKTLSQEVQDLNKNYDDLHAVLNKTKDDLSICKHQLTVERNKSEELKASMEEWKAVATEQQKVSKDSKQLVQTARAERDIARQDAKDWKNKYLSTEESLGRDITNLSQQLDVATKERDDARAALKDASNAITSITDGNQPEQAIKESMPCKNKHLNREESLHLDVLSLSKQRDVVAKERDDAQLEFVKTMRTLQTIVSRGFHQQPSWIDQVDQLTSSMIQTAKAWGMSA
jgi:chromosome segregation ATPase